jgi:1-acyl-sn-glycerol-3-phosphate acyltransferase
MWLLLLGIVALLSLSSRRVSFVEDISSFLPNNADNTRINEAYQHVGAANKIVVSIAPVDSAEAQTDSPLSVDLEEVAARFAEILQETDSARHIKQLLYEVDEESIKNVTDFITLNLPYFLEDEDYRRIDSLIQPQAIENQLKADKDILLSPMGGFVREVLLNDPMRFSERALKNLETFGQNDNYNTDNGFIYNKQGEVLVIITSKEPVSETANNKLLADAIYAAVNKTQSEFHNQIKITAFGAALISITNAEQIKKDSIFAISIALVLILALLFYFFRNIKPLFFIALSVAFGALFSFGLIVLLRSTVSVIALGIFSIIVGIAINYPLHFLAHFRHNNNIKQTLKEIVNPLIIGNITTVGAFLSLLFISSDAMKDLGLFSAFLLVGTVAFVLIFLPQLLVPFHSLKGGKHSSSFGGGRVGAALSEFSPEKNKIIVFVFFVFTIVLFFFSFGAKFETNLHAINYMTAEQRAKMNKLIEENKSKTLYVVTEGKTTEDALQNYEKEVKPRLNEYKHSGISNLFPSKELQRQKNERWNEFWEWNDGAKHECSKKDFFIGLFNKISETQGFNPAVFNNFISTINNDFQPQEFEFFAPIYNGFGENYFSIQDDKTLIYTILQIQAPSVSPNEGEQLALKTSSENEITDIFPSSGELRGVFSFDDTSIAQRMVSALSSDFNNVLYICAFIVFMFLFFSFGRIEIVILTFIPMAVAWIWILGLMNILGLKFNIVNIILATFIFGQGDDYTIFVTEGLIYEYTYRKRMLASFKNSIILSATILFVAIGTLIFAEHPAMRSLAELTIVGMFSVVLCAYLFPPLIFRFLTHKKGKPREVPWTLRRFMKMVYAFVVFLTGSLLTTIYGFILFGFRKKAGEKNKLRYHKLLHWISNFVIRHVPDVKLRYKNLSGETFEKPAVIISNHQSHLDLMCLMMLTPKLIILTNDWVWNSPFYGRIIRYADFYPVSKGIENSIEQLADAVGRGYSIAIFPEGTRSINCSIGRFHRGAFFLSEKLGLDIVPVFLHGLGHVLPKNDFLLRKGQITVQVHERIMPTDKCFAADYPTRTKQICIYYRETFAEIAKEFETPEYFKDFVLHNYLYKGVEVFREAKNGLKNLMTLKTTNDKIILIENNDCGVFAFLYALANKDRQVIAIEEDNDKAAIARACAGKPYNLTIYSKTEWESI